MIGLRVATELFDIVALGFTRTRLSFDRTFPLNPDHSTAFGVLLLGWTLLLATFLFLLPSASAPRTKLPRSETETDPRIGGGGATTGETPNQTAALPGMLKMAEANATSMKLICPTEVQDLLGMDWADDTSLMPSAMTHDVHPMLQRIGRPTAG